MITTYKLGANNIVFGEGALDYLKSMEGKRAFIVTGGKTLKKIGVEQIVVENLKEAGFDVEVFDGVENDPSFETVYKGSREMLKFKPDWIIGLGGGSSMDAAKAMWVLYENENFVKISDIAGSDNEKRLREKARLCCIPSTSGTGSEVTRAAVITDSNSNIKYAMGDKELRLVPDIAILDPLITLSKPAKLTAATGMDAVTHAVETYISCKSNQMSDILSKGAFELAYTNLEKAVKDPGNVEARGNMLLASAVAGISFSNGGLGMCHSISHAIGGLYSIPHGLANAIILPKVLEYYAENDEDTNKKYKALSKSIDKEDLIEAIKQLNKTIGIPSTFAELVEVKDLENELDNLVGIALKDGNTGNSPLVPNRDELKEIIKEILR